MLLSAARHGWGRGGAAAWVGMGPMAELGVREAAEGGESGGATTRAGRPPRQATVRVGMPPRQATARAGRAVMV